MLSGQLPRWTQVSMKACATVTQRPANKRVNLSWTQLPRMTMSVHQTNVVATFPSALRIPHIPRPEKLRYGSKGPQIHLQSISTRSSLHQPYSSSKPANIAAIISCKNGTLQITYLPASPRCTKMSSDGEGSSRAVDL
jgi:hypothetical protein